MRAWKLGETGTAMPFPGEPTAKSARARSVFGMESEVVWA